MHPLYDEKRIDADYALMELAAPIDFAAHPHIRPVCWPTTMTYPGQGVKHQRFLQICCNCPHFLLIR